MNYSKVILSLSFLYGLGSVPAAFGQGEKPKVPLFEGLGNHHFEISTPMPLAQRYFNQGLILAYAFNHREAARSFQEAARLDPSCAICYWGVALVLGPNINAPMPQENVPKAWEALQKAVTLSDQANEKEKAYIQALTKRYAEKPMADRHALDHAYAEAMCQVAKQSPADLDAATLCAEAHMDLHPWDYWKKNGEPQAWTPEILATLERVLAKNENHPGANHLYIHALEASPHPERALASADRLRDLVPGAGHLVHMPAHIYSRIGRDHDAVLANQRAIKVDRAYLEQGHTYGIYPLGYIPHNYHFLWLNTMREGRSAKAIQVARETATQIDRQRMREPGLGALQHYYVLPLYALARFGKWEAILNEPAPAKDLRYPTGIWHYVRGLALTATGQREGATQELNKLKTFVKDPSLEKVKIWDVNSTADILKIAVQVLAGKLAAQQDDFKKAIHHLETAVVLEDALHYNEPSDWYYPVRQSLGAVLLEAGRPVAAEKAYREDLRYHPENGWSLFGLSQSLQAQGKTEEAQQINQRFKKAWARADITLNRSDY